MLENGPTLRTWRLAELPIQAAKYPARLIGDHRREYLDYEGPISGGRGSVTRMESGECEVIEDGANRIKVKLISSKPHRTIELAWDHQIAESSPQ